MQVYVGTVVRAAPVRDGGELFKLDWETKSIVRRLPIFPENPALDHDPNPRGNGRGCRGIVLHDGQVIAATYHTLKVFDNDLEHQRDVTHGLMVGLHEIQLVDSGGVWTSSTTVDAALRFDLATGDLVEGFWPREVTSFQQSLELVPGDYDKSRDLRAELIGVQLKDDPCHLHLNAVCAWDGSVYALLNRFGVVANLSSGEIVIRDPRIVGAHNLVILDDGKALVCATRSSAVRVYDIHAREFEKEIRLLDFPWVRDLERRLGLGKRWHDFLTGRRKTVAKPFFVRGLDVVGDLVFVGFSPASVVCFHRGSGEFVDSFNYSEDVRVCVHGLKVSA